MLLSSAAVEILIAHLSEAALGDRLSQIHFAAQDRIDSQNRQDFFVLEADAARPSVLGVYRNVAASIPGTSPRTLLTLFALDQTEAESALRHSMLPTPPRVLVDTRCRL